jgi:2,5-diamino-6-(ribosylamino)-4(3H)-pyrimidinone 5'-phosphate reductase
MARPRIHVNFAANDPHASRARPCSADISCHADWRRVHMLRERYDAVAVGARTWILDQPRLTARAERLGREPLRQPARVIFAGSHRCVFARAGSPTYVVGRNLDADNDVVAVAAHRNDLSTPLKVLRDHGIESLFVEGGPTLLRSFFDQGFFDVVTIFVRARTVPAARRAARQSLGPLPVTFSVRPFGEGFLLESSAHVGALEVN